MAPLLYHLARVRVDVGQDTVQALFWKDFQSMNATTVLHILDLLATGGVRGVARRRLGGGCTARPDGAHISISTLFLD